MKRIEQAVMWRRLDGPGHDVCAHGPTDTGWRLMGTAVFRSDSAPCSLGYLVDAGRDWCVRSAHVFGTIGTLLVDVFVTAADGGWLLNGQPQPRASGCVDFELGFTPATKLFTLRRLALAAGGNVQMEGVALLVGRASTLEPVRPRYTRLSEFDYAFDPGDARGPAVLRVDRHQSVVHYPGVWEREDRKSPELRGPAANGDRPRVHRPSRTGAEPIRSVAGE